MTVSVLLVDDEDLVRGGLRAILEATDGIAVVGEAADGAVVVPLVRSLQPDVVLMDIRMPLVDGITATRDLRSRLPRPPSGSWRAGTACCSPRRSGRSPPPTGRRAGPAGRRRS